MGAMTVRQIPDDVHHRLGVIAASRGLSLEAYVRDLLVSAAAGRPLPHPTSLRMRALLEQINRPRIKDHWLTPSRLAQMLGHPTGGDVDAWTRGERHIPDDQIDRLAGVFGINAAWLAGDEDARLIDVPTLTLRSTGDIASLELQVAHRPATRVYADDGDPDELVAVAPLGGCAFLLTRIIIPPCDEIEQIRGAVERLRDRCVARAAARGEGQKLLSHEEWFGLRNGLLHPLAVLPERCDWLGPSRS